MFPLCQAFGLTFTPSWRLRRIGLFRPLRRATADRGGSDELLKKLEQNFQTDNAKQFDKSKFDTKGDRVVAFLCVKLRDLYLNDLAEGTETIGFADDFQ